MYLIADGCAEDIISVSLLSNAFKSSQATCSKDILRLLYRFYAVALLNRKHILSAFWKSVKIFFVHLFSFQLHLIWHSWKSPKQLHSGREYKIWYFLIEVCLICLMNYYKVQELARIIYTNFILNFKLSACILHMNDRNMRLMLAGQTCIRQRCTYT